MKNFLDFFDTEVALTVQIYDNWEASFRGSAMQLMYAVMIFAITGYSIMLILTYAERKEIAPLD